MAKGAEPQKAGEASVEEAVGVGIGPREPAPECIPASLPRREGEPIADAVRHDHRAGVGAGGEPGRGGVGLVVVDDLDGRPQARSPRLPSEEGAHGRREGASPRAVPPQAREGALELEPLRGAPREGGSVLPEGPVVEVEAVLERTYRAEDRIRVHDPREGHAVDGPGRCVEAGRETPGGPAPLPLPAGVALLVRRRDEAPIDDEGRARVVGPVVDAEDDHADASMLRGEGPRREGVADEPVGGCAARTSPHRTNTRTP